MNRTRLFVTALALTAAFAAPAAAQSNPCATPSCTVTDHLSLHIDPVVRLELSQTATALTTPDTTAYDAGSNTTTGPTVSVKANRSWTLSVKAAASNFTPSSSGGYAKPAADVGVSMVNGTTIAALSTANATLASGSTGGTLSGLVTYTTKFNYALDVPDDYTLDVVYTITAP